MGYSLNLFLHQDQIHDEFICSICQDVMKEPIMSQGCEHIYCTNCINNWGQTSSELANTCPIDRSPIAGLRAPFRAFMNVYNDFKLACWFQECEGVFKLDEIEAHVTASEFNPEATLPCNYNCGAVIKMKDLPEHDCYAYLKQQVEKKDSEILQLKQDFEEKLITFGKLKEEIDHVKAERIVALSLKDKEIDQLKKQVAANANAACQIQQSKDDEIRNLKEEVDKLQEEHAKASSLKGQEIVALNKQVAGSSQREKYLTELIGHKNIEVNELKRNFDKQSAVLTTKDYKFHRIVAEKDKEIGRLKEEIYKNKKVYVGELDKSLKNKEIDTLLKDKEKKQVSGASIRGSSGKKMVENKNCYIGHESAGLTPQLTWKKPLLV